MSQGKASRFAAPAQQTVEADALVYGDSKPIILDPNRHLRARSISLTEILPDPAQPRRAVPSAARAAWDGRSNAESISAMLGVWVGLAETELQAPLQIYIAAEPPEEYKRPEIEEANAPISFKLFKLVDLANDIFANGLHDPISINAVEGGYRTEYGERRWLAHWWLYLATSDEKWTKINAFVRDEFDVWRQASENGARDQLNAISLARQFARLLMDIYQKETTFRSFAEMVSACECDRAYYAQVADGEQFRVPRGWGEKIVAAMGLSHTTQLRQYRALLRLPDDIWVKGDDQSWGEHALRSYTVTTVTVSSQKKPRELTPDEKGLKDDTLTMLLALRRGEGKVNEAIVERIEKFCRRLRETGKVVKIEARR
ncbi:MAG: hypothetical protein KF716_08655 [Anaerolineae bacterium]|nr:hypothetical protein [Anaerolineae bacterium]